LTPEQRYKILPILDEQFKEMKAVRADDNLTRAQARAKMLAIRTKYFDRVTATLTPEQQKKADELKTRFAERCKFRQEKMTQQTPVPQK
jgi:Zn-dependent oligopeptidase